MLGAGPSDVDSRERTLVGDLAVKDDLGGGGFGSPLDAGSKGEEN
jgi:hypothetical protein